MKTTKADINKDVDLLRSDVRRVRADVAGIVHSAKSRSRNTVMETGDRIRGIMADLRDRTKERVRDKSEAVKDRGYETVENWRSGIGHRPLTSLIVAFAAGLVFAAIVNWRRW
jgi:ElaB/YqjD/DUF883 family membrane-anchored ribosome-binding protein